MALALGRFPLLLLLFDLRRLAQRVGRIGALDEAVGVVIHRTEIRVLRVAGLQHHALEAAEVIHMRGVLHIAGLRADGVVVARMLDIPALQAADFQLDAHAEQLGGVGRVVEALLGDVLTERIVRLIAGHIEAQTTPVVVARREVIRNPRRDHILRADVIGGEADHLEKLAVLIVDLLGEPVIARKLQIFIFFLDETLLLLVHQPFERGDAVLQHGEITHFAVDLTERALFDDRIEDGEKDLQLQFGQTERLLDLLGSFLERVQILAGQELGIDVILPLGLIQRLFLIALIQESHERQEKVAVKERVNDFAVLHIADVGQQVLDLERRLILVAEIGERDVLGAAKLVGGAIAVGIDVRVIAVGHDVAGVRGVLGADGFNLVDIDMHRAAEGHAQEAGLDGRLYLGGGGDDVGVRLGAEAVDEGHVFKVHAVDRRGKRDIVRQADGRFLLLQQADANLLQRRNGADIEKNAARHAAREAEPRGIGVSRLLRENAVGQAVLGIRRVELGRHIYVLHAAVRDDGLPFAGDQILHLLIVRLGRGKIAFPHLSVGIRCVITVRCFHTVPPFPKNALETFLYGLFTA